MRVFFNGAADVSVLEPTRQLLYMIKNEEYQYIEVNLCKIAA